MTINIEYQDQNGNWKHSQTKQNQADAYRAAQRRAESTKKRHRLVDQSGALLDCPLGDRTRRRLIWCSSKPK
ncbi:hypothetical protein [Cyanobium sp. WAJ14-Wanaka]|uniref:hypothetical protein n=1 Tax=Cyanobium sp. WAJ14-Wanaka TaxID=2823725 RepID=UPI0020CD3BE7|nr:hypothetical protein [Cyanobium sp. WAJ14-Wanaka]MCP9775992.1 hypothetical protein [Cyanobium sp. WAJ14-Wanaka]